MGSRSDSARVGFLAPSRDEIVPCPKLAQFGYRLSVPLLLGSVRLIWLPTIRMLCVPAVGTVVDVLFAMNSGYGSMILPVAGLFSPGIAA